MSYELLNQLKVAISESCPDASPEEVVAAAKRACGAASAVLYNGSSQLTERQAVDWILKKAERSGLSNSAYCTSIGIPHNTLSLITLGQKGLNPELASKFGLRTKTTYRVKT
jgi:hypothetical protein